MCGQHANLLQEVFKPGRLLGGAGEDQLLLGHGASVMGCIEFFMQDFNSRSELGGFLIKLAEASDLPSQPPVVKVADVALEVYEVTAGPDEEGTEPGGEWFNGVLLAMPNRVSLCIQIDNIGDSFGPCCSWNPATQLSSSFLIHFAGLKTPSPKGMKKWGTRLSFSMYPSGARSNMFS